MKLRSGLAVWSLCISTIVSSASGGLNDGLVAFYPFNGNANDESGLGNNATVYSVSTTTDRLGLPASAYDFNGTSSYVAIPLSSSLDLTTQFTLSAWIYQKSAQPAGYRIIDKSNAGIASGFNFDTYGANTGGRQLRLNGFSGDVIGGTQYTLMRWHHVVATVSGTLGKVYLDGNLDGTGYVGNIPHNSLDIFIGRAHPSFAGLTEWFNGTIDDVRMYNRALTEAEVWQLSQDHTPSLRSIPEYHYDGANGPHAIMDLRSGTDGQFSFVFATTNVGARCLVSWTTTFREWFSLLHFDANTVGTEVTDTTPAPQTFYRTTYLPAGVSPAEGFDYPFGTGEPVPEQITPERNSLYPINPIDNPQRYAAAPGAGWYNYQDVGSYYDVFGGLHPGEDWNKGGGSDDVGESVRAVANGQVVDIRAASKSGVAATAGYVVVLRHWLLNGDSVDSLYVHVAPDTNGGGVNRGGLVGEKTDFTYQVGMPVAKGSVIGVIGAITSPAMSPHLHFEMRNKKVGVSGQLWPNSTGDAYYGPAVGESGNRTPTISQSDVKAAFRLLQEEGIFDPSDFIDDHRQ